LSRAICVSSLRACANILRIIPPPALHPWGQGFRLAAGPLPGAAREPPPMFQRCGAGLPPARFCNFALFLRRHFPLLPRLLHDYDEDIFERILLLVRIRYLNARGIQLRDGFALSRLCVQIRNHV